MTQAQFDERFSVPELLPGSTFASYEIIRKIGEGGMGAVYEARRQGLDKRVALKILTAVENAAMTARFVQEARIAAALEHPHVVDCFDVGEFEGKPFLTMELLEGESLKDRLARGPLTIVETCDLFLPLCSAVAAAHDHGIVHRDLKPDNIFLAKKLRQVVPKVLDFGIAKARPVGGRPGVTQTASILGTPHYMSPEQATDSKGVEPASDQFSLGSILWECLTGRLLFDGDNLVEVLMRVVSAPVDPPSTVNPEVPRALDQVVLRLLSRTPSERFGSMRALGTALLPFASVGARERWSAEFNDLSHQATASAGTPPAVLSAARATTSDTLQATSRSLTPAAPRSRPKWLALAVVAALALVGFGAWQVVASSPAPTPQTPHTAVRPPPRVTPPPPPTPPPLAAPPAVLAAPAAALPTTPAAAPDEPEPEPEPTRASHPHRTRRTRLRHRNL
ncbi:MAG: serine/threonine-protein kinase [Deltaproteobacteria bacterium]|nr:serine/threonine-protein kinase [Myxococcales bacterium]MDP3218941.1 serine/threonine-protein kinase [Deltaproteobacteria bacterium]